MQRPYVNTYTFAIPHVLNSFPSLFVPTAAIGTGQGGRTGVEQQPPLEKTGEDEVQPRHGTDSVEPRPPTHQLRPSLGTIQSLGYVFRLPASNRRRLSHDIYQIGKHHPATCHLLVFYEDSPRSHQERTQTVRSTCLWLKL